MISHADRLRALAGAQVGIMARGQLISAAAAFCELETRAALTDAALKYWRERALKAEALMLEGVRELASLAPPPPDPPAAATEEAEHHGRAI